MPERIEKIVTRYKPPVRLLMGIFLGVVLAALAYFLAGKSVGSDAGAASGSPGKVILRLSGSNTVGAELGPALAEEFFRRRLGATDVRTIRGDKEDEVRVQGILPGESSPKTIEIHAHGSATAFEDFGNLLCDVGMASRKIKADEASRLAAFGDMTSASSEHVVGLDGIAVIVSNDNAVRSLTKEQIARVFAGEILDWKQLGGSRAAIDVYARDDKSGTYDTFKALVLGSRRLVANAKRFEDSRELSDAVAKDPNGIGFIGLPYVRDAKAVAVSENGTRPFLPNHFTVSTEDYTLSRRLFLYTSSNLTNDVARAFVNFALSPHGQEIVEKIGFVGQSISPTPTSILSDAPVRYRQSTTGATRLSLDFRFRSGSSDLDNKALADLDRVVSFLTDLRYSGQNILLFGFADGSGTPQVNDALSKNRATAVAQQFEQRGVNAAAVIGLGSELPVASNETPEGREKNRRVEIWLKK